MKFTDQNTDPVNGSTLFNIIFGNQGVTRHKEFKAFFGSVNLLIPTPPTSSHPNWKIEPFLKHFMRMTKETVILGRDVSVEQDIGFQGQHKVKQRVTFKKMGDGFSVDCLSSDGYTYIWYFQNQVAPQGSLCKGNESLLPTT